MLRFSGSSGEYSKIASEIASGSSSHKVLGEGDTSACYSIEGKPDQVVVVIETADNEEKIENVTKFLTKLNRLKATTVIDGKTYIFQERVEGAPVSNIFLDGEIFSYTPEQKIDLALKVIAEVKKLHDVGVMHGDLHPDNMLLKSTGEVGIIDFDLSEEVGDDGTVKDPKITPEGTHHAPEWKDGDGCSLASDMYSLGIFLKEGIADFLGLRLGELETSSVKQSDAIEGLQEMLRKCTADNPGDRPTISELQEQVKTFKVKFTEKPDPRPHI